MDDIAAYCSRITVNNCKNLLLTAIHVIQDNLWSLGLSLSAHKTVLVYFNRDGVKPRDIALKIEDSLVRNSEAVKYHF